MAGARLRDASVRRAPSIAIALISILLAACAGTRAMRQPELPWSQARQIVLVTTQDWGATHGTLRRFSSDAEGWHEVGPGVPVVIGRSGSAWGLGLHPVQPGPAKREGDGRSPAGVFSIGKAFGYASQNTTRLPYSALTADDYCVDVETSPLYNRIVDARTVDPVAVAGSTEPMRRDLHAGGDAAYQIGFVIEHNPQGIPGAGSCIFAHVWKGADSTTAGCTALAEPLMQLLLDWLRPADHPVFVLLPRAEYRRLLRAWQLPEVASTDRDD